MLAREGISLPSRTIVSCPMRMAGQGVAGARITSTSAEHFAQLFAVPRAETLREVHPGCGHQRAGQKPAARERIETSCAALAQVCQMMAAAFGRRDHVSRGPRARRFGNVPRTAVHPGLRPPSTRLRIPPARPRCVKYPPAIAMRKPSMPRAQARTARLGGHGGCRPDRLGRAPASHRKPTARSSADRANGPDVIQAADEQKRAPRARLRP